MDKMNKREGRNKGDVSKKNRGDRRTKTTSASEEIVKSDTVGFPEMDYVPFYEKFSSEEMTPKKAALRRSKSLQEDDMEEDGEKEDGEERYYAPKLTQQGYEEQLSKNQNDTSLWINYAFMVSYRLIDLHYATTLTILYLRVGIVA